MKKLIFLIFISMFISCSVFKNNIELGNDLQKIELNNETIDFVRKYREELSKGTVVYLSYKKQIDSKSNTCYINRILNLSTIYNHYISYYSIVDGIPVIISSKKDGFVKPSSYSSGFLKFLTKYLIDNMLVISIKENNEEYIDSEWLIEDKYVMSIDHSEVWRVKNGELTKKWKKHPIEEKVMIENEDIDLMYYYRVIEGGIDEREKKHVPKD